MARRRMLNYDEGTCFALPLRDGGWARGVVARTSRKGSTFGYFFGPRLSSVDEARMDGLTPEGSIFVVKFGDLGLIEREWPILGRLPNWNRDEWPMPPLARVDEIEHRAWVCWYDDKTFRCLKEEEVDPALAPKFLEDGSWGAGAVEIRLTKMLKPPTNASAATAPKSA